MKIVLIGVFVASALIVGCSDAEQKAQRKKESDAELTEIKLQRIVRGFVEAKLKDPKSAEFRNQKGGCGEVNSKNSFGAYTGFKRFIAGGENMVYIEGDPILALGAFEEAWDKVCK